MSFKFTASLLKQCREVLLQCNEFESGTLLSTVFMVDELLPFRAGLPDAGNLTSRVELLLNYLAGKSLADDKPVLPIFVATLRDKRSNQDPLHEQLDALLTQIEKLINQPEAVQQSVGKAATHAALPDISNPQNLRRYMNRRFSEAELAILCHTLTGELHDADALGEDDTIDIETVGGSTKESKVLNLIQYISRRGWLPFLIKVVQSS